MRWWTCLLVLGLAVDYAGAVSTGHWTQTSDADFKNGTFHDVVATNLGDLKLSRAMKTLLEQDAKVSAVYALVEAPDGTWYAGTGPQGVLLQIKGDQVSTALTLEDGTSIFSLLIDAQGRLLMGTGGERGRVLVLEKGGEQPREIFSAQGVQYVWAMRPTADGRLLVATGPNGQLFELNPADGTSQVLLDSDEHNILCLATDGRDLVYAGTDPNGLVYRVNRKTKEVFVLYDAEESEISALALDGAGVLYAGTGRAIPESGAADEASGQDGAGRPEAGGSSAPITTTPPTTPNPPDAPAPHPSDPSPIPQAHIAPLQQAPGSGDGEPPVGGPPEAPTPTPAGAPAMPGMPGAMAAMLAAAGESSATGNAIYRIDGDGFVTEVFRQQVMVLSLLWHKGVLLAGTGSEGLIYQVDPAAEEHLVVAKVEPKQVLALVPGKDGRIFVGMANTGGIAAMSGGYAAEGTYTSAVLDASQVSRVGMVHLQGSLPKGSGLTLSTRSGNRREPTEDGWSDWSKAQPVTAYMAADAPPGRFFQYRLTFTSEDGKQTPVVDTVDVAYQVPNLPPRITSVKVGSGGAAGAAAAMPTPPGMPAMPAIAGAAGAQPQRSATETISWEASDPNGDALLYSVYMRSGSRGPWILLKDKLTETQYEWNTQTVADGTYAIRVVASDALANPAGQGRSASRVSDPVLVDNTPPAIGDVQWLPQGSMVRVICRAVDRTGRVAAVHYAVDSSDDWQATAASDSIFDSPEELVDVTIGPLSPGPHQIVLRASDSAGNRGFENLLVNVGTDNSRKE